MYDITMNQEKADNLIKNAKRTIKIIALLLEGRTPREIVELTRADRQLVEYYKKVLLKD